MKGSDAEPKSGGGTPATPRRCGLTRSLWIGTRPANLIGRSTYNFKWRLGQAPRQGVPIHCSCSKARFLGAMASQQGAGAPRRLACRLVARRPLIGTAKP